MSTFVDCWGQASALNKSNKEIIYILLGHGYFFIFFRKQDMWLYECVCPGIWASLPLFPSL